jgi:hypothetical protein
MAHQVPLSASLPQHHALVLAMARKSRKTHRRCPVSRAHSPSGSRVGVAVGLIDLLLYKIGAFEMRPVDVGAEGQTVRECAVWDCMQG